MKRNTDIITLVLKMEKNRTAIQEKLDRGSSTQQLAIDYGVSWYTMKKCLKQMNFEYSKRGSSKPAPLSGDILIVLHRVCTELNINCDEIQKYM